MFKLLIACSKHYYFKIKYTLSWTVSWVHSVWMVDWFVQYWYLTEVQVSTLNCLVPRNRTLQRNACCTTKKKRTFHKFQVEDFSGKIKQNSVLLKAVKSQSKYNFKKWKLVQVQVLCFWLHWIIRLCIKYIVKRENIYEYIFSYCLLL